MASFWQYQDYFAKTVPEHSTSPSLRRSLTPLILPPDWLEPSTSYSSADFASDIDFQSNHLDLTFARPRSESLSLSGLGIRNLDLIMDCDHSISEMANVFDGGLPKPDNYYGVDLEIFSRNHSDNEFGTIFDVATHKSSESASICSSPWTFSGLKAPDVATDSSTDLNSSFSTGTDSLFAQMSVETDTSDITLSFEELSAATGLSVADFAAQISATAEVALQNMAADGITAGESNEGDFCDPFQIRTNIDDMAPKWLASTFVAPSEHSVFRRVLPSWNNSCIGVNPADILPVPHPTEMSVSSPTPLLGHLVLDPLPGEDSIDTPRSGVLRSPFLSLQNDVSSESFPFLHPVPSQDNRELSGDEHSQFQSPSSSEYSPSLGGGQKKTMPRRNNRRRITRSICQSDLPLCQSPETPGHCDESAVLPINLGTPVFDAHRGIDIEVLKAKAERYRLRNQGREYDKRWLISFAGKLTNRGELMDEFRCYIAGCKQTNKRRDHILIHVGAHLDQRPFKCMYWYVDKKSSLKI